MMNFKLSGCVFLLVVILSGCNKVAPDSAANQSQPASGKTAEQVAPTAAPPEDRFARLKQKLDQGYYEEVIEGAKKAYLQTREDRPVWAWRFRLLQALATSRHLEFDQALALLNIQPPVGLPVEEFVRRDIIAAEALCRLGRNRDGIAALGRVKPMLAPASADPILNADWLFIRGKCEPFTSGVAKTYFEQASKLAHGQDKWLEAAASGMLAYRLALLERFDEALDRYKPALSLTREIGSLVLEEGILGYMGQSYFELGEFQKAEQYEILAEKLAAELGQIDHRARHLIDIGIDEQSRGRLTESEDYYLKAIALARTDYDKKDSGAKEISDDIIARSLNNLTVIELSTQSLDKAEDYHRQAADLKKSGDDLLTWKLSQIDLALARKNFPVARTLLGQLFSEKDQGFRLRWSAQERMAQMYELTGNVLEAEKWYRATVDTAVKSSVKLNHQEYKTSLLSNLDFFSDYIEFLLRNNRPEQALQVAEIGRARALAAKLNHNLPAENTTTWLAGIQAGLKHSDKRVLAYWESKTQLYIWLVTASQVKLVQQAIGVRELERTVIRYQHEVEQHKSLQLSPASRRLYEILVQPFQSFIPKDSQVVIVAHGSLYEINFESLIVPGPELHYWIQDVRLENAISLSHVINSSRSQSHYKKEILAIGAAIQVEATFPAL